MHPVEVAPGIFWVGAVDWNVRDFHGYSTESGTTYNSFLILDEKIALIDTVKAPFADDLLDSIRKVVDPKKIDVVVSNHTEMDHTGGLARVMHLVGEEKPLVCSKMGKKNLSLHFSQNWNYQAVADGDTLNLGKRNLVFVETRMLHWPDSMFSYCPEEKTLFSSDAFGQHYAGPERFDDEMGETIWPHARKYYANILLPYSQLILKLVERVSEMGIEIDRILPDHGIMWRKDPAAIVGAYAEWAAQKPEKKAVVIYDTMWQSTRKMAEAMTEGISAAGIPAKSMHLRSSHRSDVMTRVMESGLVAVGSPTINNGLFPTMADFLTYMKGLKPKNKLGAAFGSFGWSGESVKIVEAELSSMGFEMPEESLRVQYVPGEENLAACFEMGKRLGQALAGKSG